MTEEKTYSVTLVFTAGQHPGPSVRELRWERLGNVQFWNAHLTGRGHSYGDPRVKVVDIGPVMDANKVEQHEELGYDPEIGANVVETEVETPETPQAAIDPDDAAPTLPGAQEPRLTKKDLAEHWLLGEMAAGLRIVGNVKEDAVAQGISKSMLDTVKRKIGVEAFSQSGQWFWHIPGLPLPATALVSGTGATAGTPGHDTSSEELVHRVPLEAKSGAHSLGTGDKARHERATSSRGHLRGEATPQVDPRRLPAPNPQRTSTERLPEGKLTPGAIDRVVRGG